MNKRTLLKTLAFVVGLYFFLEYVLPEKIGGDFDCFEVQSPATVQTDAGQLLFYVGQYRKEIGAVGRMLKDPGTESGWRRSPDGPVMQRSLFMTFDRWGMSQLDSVAMDEGLYLLYIGLNPEQLPVLCYAISRDNGLSWDKRGPVLFSTNSVPTPSINEPNGMIPGPIQNFAVSRNGTNWQMLLVLKSGQYGKSVWQASGATLKAMVLTSRPVLYGNEVLTDLACFDAELREGEEHLYFVQTNMITAGVLGNTNDFAVQWRRYVPLTNGTLASLRVDAQDDRMYFGTQQLRPNQENIEQSVYTTRLFSMTDDGTGTPEQFKRVGRPAHSTYLSHGTKWAGEFMQIVGSFAIFIAMINLVIFHGKKIVRVQKSSYNSIIFLVFLVLMMVLAYIGTPDTAKDTNWRYSFDFLFNCIQLPMGAAIFSMITFYMISAAYRSFKIKSAEAALLMLSAMIVMVGQMPIGEWLAIPIPEQMKPLQLPWLAQKLLAVFNAAAYRGVLIGMLIGGLSISLRVWLGLDNSVYSSLDKKE